MAGGGSQGAGADHSAGVVGQEGLSRTWVWNPLTLLLGEDTQWDPGTGRLLSPIHPLPGAVASSLGSQARSLQFPPWGLKIYMRGHSELRHFLQINNVISCTRDRLEVKAFWPSKRMSWPLLVGWKLVEFPLLIIFEKKRATVAGTWVASLEEKRLGGAISHIWKAVRWKRINFEGGDLRRESKQSGWNEHRGFGQAVFLPSHPPIHLFSIHS